MGSSEILQIIELLNSQQECSLNLQAFKQCEFIRELNCFSCFFKISTNMHMYAHLPSDLHQFVLFKDIYKRNFQSELVEHIDGMLWIIFNVLGVLLILGELHRESFESFHPVLLNKTRRSNSAFIIIYIFLYLQESSE